MNQSTQTITSIKYNAECLVHCQNCGATIGSYVQVGDKVWLEVGSLRLYDAHGICNECSVEFHWSSSGQQLENLIKRLRV